MKRKILGILFVGVITLTASGCNEKKEAEDKTPKIICTSTMDTSEMKIKSLTTMELNSNYIVSRYTVETTATMNDKELYEMYIKTLSSMNEDIDDDATYSYSVDEANNSYTTKLDYVITDEKFKTLSDEEKEEAKAKNLLAKLEKEDDVKCELKNVTRGELGL